MRRSRGSHGATAVEYALGIGLVVLGLIVSWEVVERESTDELSERGASIGHPEEPPDGGGGTTGGPTGGTDGGTTGGSPPAYDGVVNGSCTGGVDDEHNCGFVLSPAPTGSVEWSINPDSPGSVDAGAKPVFVFKKAGTFSVRALVDGTTTVQRAVQCADVGSGRTKTLKCALGAAS